MKIRGMLASAALAGVLVLYSSLSFGNTPRDKWPSSQCEAGEGWITFAGLQMCPRKSDVLDLEHLNMSVPALAMKLRMSDGVREVGFLRLSDRALTGGLDEYLGVSPEEVFDILFFQQDRGDVELIRGVARIYEGTELIFYERDDMRAYAILRSEQDYSAIYFFRSGSVGAIQVAGTFDRAQVEEILSLMK